MLHLSLFTKRWEFRSYNSTIRGKILIASARGPPLKTGNVSLNSAAKQFPRGVGLATAILTNTFVATNKDLEKNFNGSCRLKIHGQDIVVAAPPLGEPIEDIKLAIADNSWQSYVWEFSDVLPLPSLIPMCKRSNSTWSTIDIKESEEAGKRQLITSYF